MTEPSAKVIADSISPGGNRLTTIEVVMHRFVLAEFNTHRMLSRNSASSRAIPVSKQLDRVKSDVAFPISLPAEQPGMQGGSELIGQDHADATNLLLLIRNNTVDVVEQYLEAHPDLGHRVHKSVLNRVLEPFMWHTVIVTATEWSNFWTLRCSPLAQPEMRVAAEAMKEAYDASAPRQLGLGQWHLPYLEDEGETTKPWSAEGQALERFKMISAARCCRVSYLTHDGKRDVEEDVALYSRLIAASPPHASPLEHVATPIGGNFVGDWSLGNFVGWRQLRHEVFGQ